MSKGSKPGGSNSKPLSRRKRSELVERLRQDAALIAEHFNLEYLAIEAENARVKRRYGSCHMDGRIKIRLRHLRTGKPLKYSSMIDTLCHELAHLKHFHHGPRFRAFYLEILEWARSANIYRPSPRKSAIAQSAIIGPLTTSRVTDAGGAAEVTTVLAAIPDPQSVPSGGLVHAAGSSEAGTRKAKKLRRAGNQRNVIQVHEQLSLFDR